MILVSIYFLIKKNFFVLLHIKIVKKYDQQFSNFSFPSSEGIWSLRDLNFLINSSIGDNPHQVGLFQQRMLRQLYKVYQSVYKDILRYKSYA